MIGFAPGQCATAVDAAQLPQAHSWQSAENFRTPTDFFSDNLLLASVNRNVQLHFAK